MIDADLVEEVETLTRRTPGLSALSAEDTDALVDRVAVRFSVDRSRLWWWEGLQGARAIACDSADELGVLERLLPQNGALTLVVTDDESPPWIAVTGPWPSLSRMLQGARLFEFFVIPDKLDWIVFSTHENCLVFAGSLASPETSS